MNNPLEKPRWGACARTVPLHAVSGLCAVPEAMNKAQEMMGLLPYGSVLLLGCLETQHVSIKQPCVVSAVITRLCFLMQNWKDLG